MTRRSSVFGCTSFTSRSNSGFIDDPFSGNNKAIRSLFHSAPRSGLDMQAVLEDPAFFNDDDLLVKKGLMSSSGKYPSFSLDSSTYWLSTKRRTLREIIPGFLFYHSPTCSQRNVTTTPAAIPTRTSFLDTSRTVPRP